MHAKKIVSALALATMLLSAGAAYAQTTTVPTTPAVPNTGAGGDAPANLALLGGSAVVLVAGVTYLLRKKVPQ